MKKEKQIINHYLSISNKVLIKNNIIISFFYLLELSTIYLQIIEIYYYQFNASNLDNINYFSPFIYLYIELNKISDFIKSSLYLIIIIIIVLNSIILNNFRLKINFFIQIMINLSELLFYRTLSLFFFNYLFIQKVIFLVINFIFTILYIIILFSNFIYNHLSLFIPNITSYPFDTFSMIIDLHFIIIKLSISISRMTLNTYISEFFFIISILIIYILCIYLSYLLIYKSYYLMNNHSLNKIRYSLLLSLSILIIFLFIIDRTNINNIFYIICNFNLIIIFVSFINYFYNPYKFVVFGKDDNIENIYFYFFIFDRDKNSNLLLEEKIEEHLSKCNKCNLCKKYKNIQMENNKELDLYTIISNSKNPIFSLMNKLIRDLKKNGKKSFVNNTYVLINLIHIYCTAINQKNYNIMLNIELIFDIINSANELFLEQYEISLSQIKYTNSFINKAKQILELINKIFDEKKLDKKIKMFFELGNELNELKYKKIKSNINNSNNISGHIEGLPNCNNLLAICSLFYEELYNESISNSNIPIRDSPNILEDLINNNYRNSKQITLELNLQNFEIIIKRAGGLINKYENNNFFDFFSPIFKKKQISELRKVLFQLNSNDNSIQNKKVDKEKTKRVKDNEKQCFNFTFIIEEKENGEIFCKLLKLKLYYILLTKLDNKIFLNGVYTLDNNIIVTETIKMDEIVLFFGNKEQKNYIHKLNKESDVKKIFIKKNDNNKYLGHKKLKKLYNYLGCKKYSVYHFLLSNLKIINEKKNNYKEQITNNSKDENSNGSNNKFSIFNDLASQTSSTTSSINQNNLITYNRGNKKLQKNKNIIKELNNIKYMLFCSFFIFFIILIIEALCLKRYYQFINNNNNFYSLFENYLYTYYKLFFSVISLTCLSNSPEENNCKQYLERIPYIVIYEYFGKEIDFYNINETLKSKFIDIKELIFCQSQIYSEKANKEYNKIIYFLSKLNQKKLLEVLESELIHYKIIEKEINDTVKFSLASEIIDFNSLNLLMISRFSMITNNISNFEEPIYILNKTGEEVFNNIYNKKKLTIYQENIYLLLLDYKIYNINLYLSLNKIVNLILISKKNLNSSIYIGISLNIIFFIIIIIILILYLLFYYIIIFRDLRNIYNNLKEKIGDISFKDVLKNKLDNLKIMLNVYDSDITKIVENLNDIYNCFKENHMQKIKEESRLLKKDIKFENNIKNSKKLNYFKILKSINKYELIKYSQRKNLFSYTLIFIILIYIIVNIINILIWYLYFKKETKVNEWNIISESTNGVTNNLMNNYLMMVYNNSTLDEISMEMAVPDFISYTYQQLSSLYELKNYIKYIQDLLKVTEMTMEYECSKFYQNIQNEVFLTLKNKFKEKENKLIYTMQIFCEWSNLMIFNNYKSLFLKFFNDIKVDMENFNNYKYSDIIEFVEKLNLIKIQVMFLTIFVYLMDIINENVQASILSMTNKIFNNIIISMTLYLIALIFIISTIFIVYIRNINNECKKFLRVIKIFQICKLDE